MKISKWWSKFLSDMKKLDLKIENMPPDVAESALVIHQQALLEYKEKRESKKLN